MNQNVRDWPTTLAGLGVIFVTAAIGIARIKYPMYEVPLDNLATTLTTYAGAHLIIGARSGNAQ